jgi:hypothetical protein
MTTYKRFEGNDKVTATSLLHEFVPITGSIVTGTYSDNNIKNYTHGMFQSVYDYPYLSSSANHIFDISVGLAPELSSALNTQNDKKMQIYNEMAQVLAGYNVTGSILRFDRDGNYLTSGSNSKHEQVVILSFSRLLTKDELKKNTFRLTVGTGSSNSGTPNTSSLLTIGDYGADLEYRVNSPAGEYGILYTGSAAVEGTGVGLLYYQAGIAVITSSVFDQAVLVNGKTTVNQAFTGSSIQDIASGIRRRWNSCTFSNTTELNSTIYFCRINNTEFNYSSNPTYLSSSQIRVKNVAQDMPVTYITTVGLYGQDNELLAVAKLSEPLKKTPENEMILRVRLDY